jgi:flagellar L-ring protein precursor FlgH
MKLLLCALISTALSAALSAQVVPSPGSLYSATSHFADLTRDLRANGIDDLVTVLVSDTASAVSSGVSNSSRKASAAASVTGIAGITSPRLSNLLNLSNNNQLQGQGQTSRNMTITTTVTARVTEVTPAGNLVIEGLKNVGINSEKQTVILRGMVRPVDLTSANTIRSDQVGNLTIQVNGKGVVGDAIRRPNILYRVLMGLLPF